MLPRCYANGNVQYVWCSSLDVVLQTVYGFSLGYRTGMVYTVYACCGSSNFECVGRRGTSSTCSRPTMRFRWSGLVVVAQESANHRIEFRSIMSVLRIGVLQSPAAAAAAEAGAVQKKSACPGKRS